MNKILNRKIDEETIILEEKTLKSSEYADVRCILIQEKRELHVSVLHHEISKLKKRLMTAHDNESGALMDQIIHLKKLINGMKGDYDIFEVRAHWYVATDLCDYLELRCHRDFLEKIALPGGLRMERVRCSDGKRHWAYLVSGNELQLMGVASFRDEARRFCSIIMDYYPPFVYLESLGSVDYAKDKTISILTEALEKQASTNGALHRNLAHLDKEISRLKHKEALFEDIRFIVEYGA